MPTRRLALLAPTLAAALALAGAAAAPKRTPELIEQGRVAFKLNCASCHGDTGEGDGVSAAALNPKPRNLAKDPLKHGTAPADIFATLEKGIPGTAMIAFTHLTESDRWALAYYVAELRKEAKGKARD